MFFRSREFLEEKEFGEKYFRAKVSRFADGGLYAVTQNSVTSVVLIKMSGEVMAVDAAQLGETHVVDVEVGRNTTLAASGYE